MTLSDARTIVRSDRVTNEWLGMDFEGNNRGKILNPILNLSEGTEEIHDKVIYDSRSSGWHFNAEPPLYVVILYMFTELTLLCRLQVLTKWCPAESRTKLASFS
jgi:hypothetical protein